VATRYFAGAREATYTPADASGVTRVVLKKAGGEQVTVLWTMRPSATTASVPATASRALKVNKFGETETISAVDGTYRIELAAATANSNEHDRADYVVGGDPIILVERTDGGVAAARPLDTAPVPAADSAQQAALIVADATPTLRDRKPTPTPTPKKK
jgi:hypothetical protein